MPLSFLYGDDAYSMNEAVKRLVSNGHYDEMDIVRLRAQTGSPQSILMTVATAGLFSTQRLVIIENFGQTKEPKASRSKPKENAGVTLTLTALLDACPESTTVVVLARGIRSDSALVKEAMKLVRTGGLTVQAFPSPRQKDMPGWIIRVAREQGLRLAPDAALELALRVGEQTSIAGIELEKLAGASAPTGIVSCELVKTLVSQSADESIFPLIDAIAGGVRGKEFELLERQLAHVTGSQTEVSLPLIRLLARQFRILLRMRLLRAEGMSRTDILSELKIPDYFADRYIRQAARLTPLVLASILQKLVHTEQAIKNGEAREAELHLLVADLTCMAMAG